MRATPNNRWTGCRSTIGRRRRPAACRCLLTWAMLALLLPPWAIAADGPEKRVVNTVGMEFVLIPAGTFIMGSPLDEADRGVNEVQHPVTLSRPFYMQTTEVTVGQWRAVMGRRLLAKKKGAGDMPVVKVSWHDCQKFIRRLSRRTGHVYALPTEAQWEYAARAGTTTAYAWGHRHSCSRAMFANNPRKYDDCVAVNRSTDLRPGRPAPVRRYPPNAWGLYDMHGNVWEWCRDLFHGYDRVSVVDPCATETGQDRVRRGGSWFGPGYSMRSANRAYGHPMSRLQNTGFRVVMILPERSSEPAPRP